jgi:hypothetical protein
LTKFISHPALAEWEFRRFYPYCEGMLHGVNLIDASCSAT